MIPAIDFSTPYSHASLPPRSRERFGRPRVVPTASGGEEVRTRDDRELVLRAIEPGDVAAMQRCFTRLSPEDVRRRFLHAMSELSTPMAQRLCRIDPAIETAYVLMDESATPAEMRGVGRIYVDEALASAEFSVLVEQSWSRRGLGALLMQRLVNDCRRRGLAELWGYVLMENRPMLELCRELGFTQRMIPDEPGTALIRLVL
ncbi:MULTISPECIES: GNAT family N-acetyltransferase [Rhodanobacter]|jgi:acetyltransferase|uniref:Acetyltransferase n=1 Tax=Rhodanobacter glycinis TaxID=582702 RepID=A0A1I4DH62_9GAMM|nr:MULTISPECIES: GNAT family N-acetyltransferase [Rhodanobacter]EIL91250.1 sortase [Rhodanobacter sp. 115]QEE25287.1 GNAT family N-acetyltransferase [Rhodanobacter glycinis]SFK91807.1 acetyltransferase [Rhodanobacter glycinis]